MARQLGLPWDYGTGEAAVAAVFDEMRHTMPSIGGITWERMQADGSVTYPCEKEGDPGSPVVFMDSFPTPTGKARFVPADIIPADERPDTEYPMVLITGRQLEHWHTGAMTRRSGVLDAIEPDPVAYVHPLDLAALGAKPGDLITIAVAPRPGQLCTPAPTKARRMAPCSCRSASTRRRSTSSPIPRSIPSARFPSSSIARCA